MGQQFATQIKDIKVARELQHVYDTSLAIMIVNLIVCTLPLAGLYWIPSVGVWIEMGLTLTSVIFSTVIYRMSRHYVPEIGFHLNRVQLIFSILTFILSLSGAAVDTSSWAAYNQCQAESSRKWEEYYRSYTVQTYKYCSDSSNVTCYAYTMPSYSASYPVSYCYWPMLSAPTIVLSAALSPLFALITSILLSIQASYLWNDSISRARKIRRGTLKSNSDDIIVATMATDGTFTLPSRMAIEFQQWLAQQQAQESIGVQVEKPPMYP